MRCRATLGDALTPGKQLASPGCGPLVRRSRAHIQPCTRLGQIVAGSWRQIALAKRLGVPRALGLDVKRWVEERLGGYIKMSIAERQEAALELKADGHSNRDVADILGISEPTVRRDTASNDAPEDENDAQDKGTDDEDASNDAPADAFAALAGVAGPGKPKFTGETEWYTPPAYLDLAREVLGGLALLGSEVDTMRDA